MISVDGLSFNYANRKVLKDITFSMGKGECLAILGTNGVGKSTLLKCINRILKQKNGKIAIQGENLHALSKRQLAQRLGYVSQSNSFSRSTVFDAVLLGRKPYIKWDVTTKDLDIVHDVIARLGLEDYSLRLVDELSGGELQKVSIARALAQEPDILMFDEPTSNLDLKNQLEVISIIKSIVTEKDISAIVTMHDLNLSIRFADKFLMFKDGKVFASGGMEIMTTENIMQVYSVSVAIENYNDIPVIIPI
ncbi:MAG: ABC transporter ATP-binding protein [Eubacteriaceae bacterium]